MEVLLDDVMIDILSRLPVKTIFHCRRVCKKWRNLVMESSFVNLHLSRSPTGFIVHHEPYINTTEDEWYDSNDPGILKWVEIEDKVDYHHLHHDPLMSLDLSLAPVLQNSGTQIVGSVNGLICLWQDSPKLDNTYICNPITREIMILPEQQYYRESIAMIRYGFGVNSLTGEYKVVRTIQHISTRHLSTRPSVLEAEVYTLGTSQWRSVGCVPYGLTGLYGFHGSIFLNDHCHWIVCYPEDTPEKLCTFDLNKETFQLFPSPPLEAIQESRLHHHSLAVLKGCLCRLDTYDFRFTIWVMKEYGIKNSWHKEVVITQSIGLGFDWPFWEHISLIEGLKDGSILMLYGDYELWIYNPHTKTMEYDEMFGRYMSGLAYHPSFLKLKNFEVGML